MYTHSKLDRTVSNLLALTAALLVLPGSPAQGIFDRRIRRTM